ncbi:SH3 domain-containing protein [Mycena floridula]|nr:SH3 domain-containing protein [Mycena floridula]
MSTFNDSKASGTPPHQFCLALHDYDEPLGDPSHLSFRHGDIMEILEKFETGWWSVERNVGERGLIPPALVTTDFTSPSPYRALHDFESDDPKELSFKKHDIIYKLDQSADWWLGQLDGKKGLVPSNFMEACTSAAPLEFCCHACKGGEDLSRSETGPSRGPRFCSALYDWETGNSGDLSFRRNDIIQVVIRRIDGWWIGTLDGRKGLVPSNFMRVLSEAEGMGVRMRESKL